MAHYRILYWKEFPVQVKAWRDGGGATAMLPKRFERAANVAAMVEGSTDSDAYLAGWQWGATGERPGDPQAALEQIMAELDEEYPWAKLQKMIRSYRASPNRTDEEE